MSEKHESKNEESTTMDKTPGDVSAHNNSPAKTQTPLDDAATEPESPVTEAQASTENTDAEGADANNIRAIEGDPTKDVKTDAQIAVNNEEAAEIGNTTNDLQKEAIKAMAMKAEKERLEREQAVEDAKRGVFADGMTLRLDAVDTSDGGAPIMLEVNGDLTVGRADNVTDYTPEIDLTPHGAYRLGLSRRHALIRRTDDGLLVKDLSSRNGTFVNGEQVNAGKTHIIRDGDELRFGNLAMRVSFQVKS